MLYTADFETTTNPDDCRVWAVGICRIDNLDFKYSNNMDWFIDFLKESDGDTFYFHNLKFDGKFILDYLFKNGYEFVYDRKELIKNTFTTLISDTGVFYSMEIMFSNGSKVTILDSLKLIPMGVDDIAKGFDLPIKKLDIVYTDDREVGHVLTDEEVDYLKNDVEIMARALQIMFNQGIDKMTLGSSALAEYKSVIGKKNFKRWFPIPTYDNDIRRSYKGGFTYCDPRTQGKDLGQGIVLDVNSLYPSVMYYSPLPFGEGIFFEGEYKEDKLYNLYIQTFTCQFELKEGYIPTIQMKNNPRFLQTEYLTSSNDEDVTLCLTSVDIQLFLEHYEVYNIVYHSGWKFKSTIGLFKNYIDKWNGIKEQATKDGNKALRTIAKFMLNNVYGKFSTNPRVQSKIPYLSNEGIVKFKLGEEETREPIYIPVGTFITAWARYKTITSAQKTYKHFAYADTDSLHLYCSEGQSIDELIEEVSEVLDIDDTALGKWKLESKFEKARFVRQKTYVEVINGELNIVCSGMPSRCYKNVTWENFVIGSEFEGKLTPKTVSGGVVLLESVHTLRG